MQELSSSRGQSDDLQLRRMASSENLMADFQPNRQMKESEVEVGTVLGGGGRHSAQRLR